jgi:hypothetical protein
MAHRAALYTIRVKRAYKRKDKYRPFGDVDESGVYLGDVLEGYLSGDDFVGISNDRSKIVQCEEATLDGEDLQAVMLHGQSGIAADIFDSAGKFRIHQETDDTHQIRCGVLLRLPRGEEIGWLAAQVINGRSAFGLMKVALGQAFKEEFEVEKLLLEITPFVQGSVLREAIEKNRLDKIRLVKYEEPDDRAVAETNRWVPAGDAARLEVQYTAREKAKHLSAGLIKKYLGGDQTAFRQIVEFQGIEFDEATVTVELEDGGHRTFNIERPEAGHPFTAELDDLEFDNDGVPTDSSVFRSLEALLTEVSS